MNSFIKKHFKDTQGFTLMEMIVSVSIMALMSTIMLVNFHSSGTKGNLNMAAQKLASDIRQVQGYALGLKQPTGTYENGGWGVYIETNNPNNTAYNFFYDKNNDGTITNPGDTAYPSIQLPAGMKFINARMSKDNGNSWTDNGTFYISFIPPDPKILICKDATFGECDYTNAEIIISNSTATSSVMVNKLGLVDVKN
jgi:prepilin-type N-terminal cleavage/methylation domain-containing protein